MHLEPSLQIPFPLPTFISTTLSDLSSLASLNVLITGTTRDIGTTCALAAVGAPHILLVQRDQPNTTSYNELLALSSGPRANVIGADLSNLDVIFKILPRAFDLAGELRVCVNCAPSQHAPP